MLDPEIDITYHIFFCTDMHNYLFGLIEGTQGYDVCHHGTIGTNS